ELAHYSGENGCRVWSSQVLSSSPDAAFRRWGLRIAQGQVLVHRSRDSLHEGGGVLGGICRLMKQAQQLCDASQAFVPQLVIGLRIRVCGGGFNVAPEEIAKLVDGVA